MCVIDVPSISATHRRRVPPRPASPPLPHEHKRTGAAVSPQTPGHPRRLPIALMVGSAILFEAGLAFLGLSDPNVVSWGQIIGSNRPYILDAGFTVTIPGLAIFVTVLSISLIGDGLNDALNPKLRAR